MASCNRPEPALVFAPPGSRVVGAAELEAVSKAMASAAEAAAFSSEATKLESRSRENGEDDQR